MSCHIYFQLIHQLAVQQPTPAATDRTMLLFSKTSLAFVLFLGAVSTENVAAENLRHEPRNLAATYTYTNQYAGSMLASVNAQRAAQGLRPLCLNTKLMAASKGHSVDMASNNYMSHTGSDGSKMSQRVTAAGYKWTRVGENVAAGQVNVAAVMKAWMNSPGHRANILGDYTMLGTAYAYNSGSTYRHYWTQNFGKGSTESCNFEEVEYDDTPTPAQNSTTEPTDVPGVVLQND